MLPGARLVRQDRLVALWRLPSGELRRVGNRVPKSCPLTPEERECYVRHGATTVCNLLMKNRGMRLAEAFNFLNLARGKQL